MLVNVEEPLRRSGRITGKGTMENRSQMQTARIGLPFGRTWDIAVNDGYARKMTAAHNRSYRRRSGKGFFIFCLCFDVLIAVGTAKCLIEGRNLFDSIGSLEAALGMYVLFPALTVFFGVMAFGPGESPVFGRKRLIRSLCRSLVAGGDGAMRARLDVLGVTLSSDILTLHIPYALCYGATEVDGETFVLVGDPKEQSVAYSMLGDNALFRDEVGFSFAVPDGLGEALVAEGKDQLARMEDDESYRKRVLGYLGD